MLVTELYAFNLICENLLAALYGVALTLPAQVTPSRVCELKLIIKISVTSVIRVTPSRVCGLKLHGRRLTALGGVSHPHGYVLKIMTISR